jgi:hypothetical protein
MVDIKTIFKSVHPSREEFQESLKEQRRILTQRMRKAETISTLATIQAEESSSHGMGSVLHEGLSSFGSAAGGQARSFSSVTNAQEIEDRKVGGDAFDEVSLLQLVDVIVQF